MKTVWILCLVTLAGATSWSLNERTSSPPTRLQRQRPRLQRLPPRGPRRDIQRLFYLKHLLELNCVRHLCKGGRCKGGKCPEPLRSNYRNQYDQVYRNSMRNNHYREPPPYSRGHPSENKMVVIPPNIYFINPRMENSQKAPKEGKLVKQNTDNVVYIQFPPHGEEARTADDHHMQDESNYINGDDMQKSSSESLAQVKTTTPHYRLEPPPTQYEVKEVIDEEPTHQEGKPFYVIQNPTEKEPTEELKNRSDVLGNDDNNSAKETVRQFSAKSRELVDEKHTRQDDAKYIRITTPVRHRVQKTQTTEQTTTRGTTPMVSTENKIPEIAALPSDLFEDLDFLTEEPEIDKPTTRKPPTMSFSEIQTTAKVVSKGLRELITAAKTDSETEWTFPETTKTSPTVVNMVKTVEYFSEETINQDLTTPNFSDHPLTFDLLPKAKPKDPETAWKNSRKMHFGDTPKTTTADRDEQRRSDILINDDYYDYENTVSTSNLKENRSLLSFDLPENPSPDDIIPLIPLVIGDLREDKIPQETIPLLSELFGKYWPAVMALSNHTDLDMLPLLKMKTEQDLESIMESVFPESSEQATTTEKKEVESSKNLYYDLYDYDSDSYKDLYKEIGGAQEAEPNDRRKRFQ